MGKISEQHWGVYENEPVSLFKMENSSGAYIELCNYGATLVSICVPDDKGELGNVILGYPELQGYLDDTAYMGATIGRFANRISQAKFMLDGISYLLEDNDNRNSNHSGSSGFNRKLFASEIAGDQLLFTLTSPDAEGGFPGNLTLKVIYEWTGDNQLRINYEAVTDRKTIANFTNHAYFNLSGRNERIFDHELSIYADEVLEAKAEYIPTGYIMPAGDLMFHKDLIREKIIKGDEIEGLNICYVLKEGSTTIRPAAVLSEAKTGRTMEVSTSYPGLLLYTGSYLASKHQGHLSEPYRPFDGLCLECQFYPDSPNHANFPSVVLMPGETYAHTIVYKFST